MNIFLILIFLIFQSLPTFPSNMGRKETIQLLEETFDIRKHKALNQTVSEEVQKCPPLGFPDYVSVGRSV